VVVTWRISADNENINEGGRENMSQSNLTMSTVKEEKRLTIEERATYFLLL